MKFEFIAKHRGIWPVTWMCGVLDVSPSGFYSWRSRPSSDRTCYDEILIRDVRRSFTDSGDTYGVRRIWLDLMDWDHDVGRERVARLVRSLKLVAQLKRRKRPVDQGQRPESAIAPNTLDREFTAAAPNQNWVADFTYVWTAEGWLYVAAVLDLFSRRIVGWSMKSYDGGPRHRRVGDGHLAAASQHGAAAS